MSITENGKNPTGKQLRETLQPKHTSKTQRKVWGRVPSVDIYEKIYIKNTVGSPRRETSGERVTSKAYLTTWKAT